MKSKTFSAGQKWTEDEERQLLDELKTMEINSIARIHQRTTGGIHARRKLIAYKMYKNHHPIEDIIVQTKLTQSQIMEYINKTELNEQTSFSVEKEIYEIKQTLHEIKQMLIHFL